MQIALHAAHATMADLPQAATVTTELDDIDALVRTYRPRLLRFVAFSIGDPDLAETITQDCFLKAWNGRAKFRGDCSVNTWLTSIALNLIRDQQRLERVGYLEEYPQYRGGTFTDVVPRGGNAGGAVRPASPRTRRDRRCCRARARRRRRAETGRSRR